MLWATGVGAEVIRPMAAPVLGGLLIADEVIDVFLPVLYFAVQKWRWRKLHRLGPFDISLPGPLLVEPEMLVATTAPRAE
jgi:copper/silver efflux system protein